MTILTIQPGITQTDEALTKASGFIRILLSYLKMTAVSVADTKARAMDSKTTAKAEVTTPVYTYNKPISTTNRVKSLAS